MTTTRRDVLTAAGAVAGGIAVPAWAGNTAWKLPEKGAVKKVDVVSIPMSDGVILRGRLWLPADAGRLPAPVVLEYIPYRTRDAYSAADDYWGDVLASHGIGFARIDIRGSGDSDGLLRDEYLAQEQDDALEIIAWLAKQTWSNGKVGMRGISWGGFSTLQTAMRNPPALKAIMPLACSDRRYTDDAHYIGGCLGLTNFKWGVSFKEVMAAPPDPAVVGDAWEKMWKERLDASPAICARWVEHRDEDDYWRHGSLRFDYASIKVPTYAVSGWVDAYVHSIPRLLDHLSCPRKGLVGPWGHTYPWLGGQGVAVDWAWEEIRWWSHWLRDEATGIMDDPMLRFFRPDATPGQAGVTPGAWAAERSWPTPNVRMRDYRFTDAGLSDKTGPAKPRKHRSYNVIGRHTPEWVPFGRQELADDQRDDDALSVTFDTPPLEAPLELLGTPTIQLRVAADRPVAQVAVRLCKVLPDGSSWRLGYGLLDLRYRKGFDRRVPLTPGEAVDVAIDLGFVAHRLHSGERLRIAISEGLWPLVWPSPRNVELTVHPAMCSLRLPVRIPPAIEPALQMTTTRLPADPGQVVVASTMEGNALRMTGTWPDEDRKCANGTVLSGFGPNTVASISRAKPATASWTGQRISRYKRGDWNCRLQCSFSVRTTNGGLSIEEKIEAYRDDVRIFERSHAKVLSI